MAYIWQIVDLLLNISNTYHGLNIAITAANYRSVLTKMKKNGKAY